MMGLFKPIIEQFHVAPSEYWNMGLREIFTLLDVKISETQDRSLTINERRIMNGMKREDLRNVIYGE